MDEPIRVLHVDDEPDFADLTATFLKRNTEQEFTVETATSASEGLNRLAAEAFDCVISDYDMPGMDGIEFLDGVREEHPDLPFILFTGKGSEEVASDAISAGVTDYLQKGGGTEQYELLATRIENAVEKARIQAERQRQLHAIETAREGIAMLDDGLQFTTVNDAYATLFGYEPEEMIGESWELVYAEEAIENVTDEIAPSLRAEGYFHGQTSFRRADGSTFVGDHVVSKTEGEEYVCLARDITERRERERELAVKTRAMDEAPVGITMTDPHQEDNPLVYANEEFLRVTGYDREDVMGWNHRVLQGPETRDEPVAELRRAIEAGESTSVELRNYRKDGTMFWNRVTIAPLRDEDGTVTDWMGFQEDVTERKEHERELETVTERMKYALDVTDSILYEINLEAGTEARHGPFERLFGIDSDRVRTTGDFYDLCVHPADRDRVERIQTEPDDDGSGRIAFEFRTHPDRGDVRWIYSEAYVRSDAEGDPQRLVGLDTDITDRREHKQELQRLKEEYESVFENVDDSLFLVDVVDSGTDGDAEFRLQRLNPANASLLGVDPEDVQGKSPTDVFDEETGSDIAANYRQCLERGEPMSYEETLTVGGEARTFETTLTPVEIDGEITRIVGVAHDITERKVRERELERQNLRLERFATVVSHDLRNPLNVAQSYLELAREDTESDHLAGVSDALERSQALIDDLLTLAREGEPVSDLEPVALASIVEECWHNVETTDATLVVDTDRTIRADPDRLAQLLENLVRNAADHARGDVTVTVGDLADGFYVADDGPGIPEDDREQIFESGYSVDESGTGFGLAIVAEIAEAHGWSIAVTDSETGGARFEITGVEIDSNW